MIEYIQDNNIEYWYGLIYIAIIVVCTIVGSFFYYQAFFRGFVLGIKVTFTLPVL
jgi:hypothetical protein